MREGWNNYEWIFISSIALITGGFMIHNLIQNWERLNIFGQFTWAFIGIILIGFSVWILIKNFKKLNRGN